MADESPSKKTIINGIYEGKYGFYISKENVPVGTVRVIDGDLCFVGTKRTKPKECVWYKFYTKKELEKMEKQRSK